jgi:hypothetical protein
LFDRTAQPLPNKGAVQGHQLGPAAPIHTFHQHCEHRGMHGAPQIAHWSVSCAGATPLAPSIA